MKKVILSVFSVVLMISLLSVSAFAVRGNYIETKWEAGMAKSIAAKTENGEEYVSVPVTGSWTSPTIDILPAMKLIISERKWVTVTICFDARISSENETQSFSVRPLVRGVQNGSSLSDAEWNEAYKKEVGATYVLFSKSSGNIMWTLGNGMTLKANEWVHFEKTVTLIEKQINNTFTDKWNLCVDNITNVDDITSLDIKNAQVLYNKAKADVNRDGVLNSADRITLSRYLVGWDVTVDSSAADVNGDGKVNTVDRIILSRYLAGWEDYFKYFE